MKRQDFIKSMNKLLVQFSIYVNKQADMGYISKYKSGRDVLIDSAVC